MNFHCVRKIASNVNQHRSSMDKKKVLVWKLIRPINDWKLFGIHSMTNIPCTKRMWEISFKQKNIINCDYFVHNVFRSVSVTSSSVSRERFSIFPVKLSVVLISLVIDLHNSEVHKIQVTFPLPFAKYRDWTLSHIITTWRTK